MSTIESQIFPWATGVDGHDALTPVVVVATDQWIPQLSAGGFLGPGAQLFRPASAAAEASGTSVGVGAPPSWAAADQGRAHTFEGDFTDPGSELRLSDGTRLAQSRYGLAQFSWLDTPAILRITDDDDFSAFLRDADVAKATGQFAAHTIHPTTVIADLAALGGGTESAGPSHRLFVFADGAVSTSPTGLPLGTVADSPAELNARWRELNAQSSRPCAICLGRAVGERDRLDALAERPWMDGYVNALRTLRNRSSGPHGDRSRPPYAPGFGPPRTPR